MRRAVAVESGAANKVATRLSSGEAPAARPAVEPRQQRRENNSRRSGPHCDVWRAPYGTGDKRHIWLGARLCGAGVLAVEAFVEEPDARPRALRRRDNLFGFDNAAVIVTDDATDRPPPAIQQRFPLIGDRLVGAAALMCAVSGQAPAGRCAVSASPIPTPASLRPRTSRLAKCKCSVLRCGERREHQIHQAEADLPEVI